MADFIWSTDPVDAGRFADLHSNRRSFGRFSVFGEPSTFSCITRGEDFAISIGFCAAPGSTTDETLTDILDRFVENDVSVLKKELIGQYILIVRRGGATVVMGDFYQSRGVFFTDRMVCTSLSVAEGSIPSEVDEYKIFEFLLMRHVLYPSWIGGTTMHPGVRYLRPFEYLVITQDGILTRTVDCDVDNNKNPDINDLAARLIDALTRSTCHARFKDEDVVATLTGGFDSRLVTAIADRYYKGLSCRIASMEGEAASEMDGQISSRVAHTLGRELKVYRPSPDESTLDRFFYLTEGMSPVGNAVIAPILEDSGSCSLGLGGCFGTESFMPLRISSVSSFLVETRERADGILRAPEEFWERFNGAFEAEFDAIRARYRLRRHDVVDELRIFNLICTGFFGSFMLAPYNIRSLQLEPYGCHGVFEVAMKTPEKYAGGWYDLRGTSHVQKVAMQQVDRMVGKIETSHSHPMLPFSTTTLHRYLPPYLRHKAKIVAARLEKAVGGPQTEGESQTMSVRQAKIGSCTYTFDGWQELFERRVRERYQ